MHSKRRIKRDKKNCVQPEAYGRIVKVRWGYLMLLGILFSLEVAAFSANAQELQPERMQAIKKADNQASVNWKLVSQEINEKNEYVYDGDKTDDTMSDRVLPKSTGNSICQCSKSCRLVACKERLGGLVGWNFGDC